MDPYVPVRLRTFSQGDNAYEYKLCTPLGRENLLTTAEKYYHGNGQTPKYRRRGWAPGRLRMYG